MAVSLAVNASKILVPMDHSQENHLKSYGIAYWVLAHEVDVEWLLNYRGGSFLLPYSKDIESECTIRGVSYEVIPDAKAVALKTEIANPEANIETIKLEKAPKIAVYSPKSKQP